MRRYLCILTIGIIIIILGLFKFGIAFFEYNGQSEGSFIVTIEKKLKETKYMKSYIAKIENKKMILYVKKANSDFDIGDKLEIHGNYSKGETQRNFGGFNYDLYLKTKKIYGMIKADSIKTIGKEKGIVIAWKKFIEKSQQFIIDILNKNLSKENASLLEGILIGYITDITDKTMNEFRDASLTHVLAISGANFVFIIEMLNMVNKKLKYRNLGHVITISIIIFFMELTGNTASVIRAGTMSIILIMSKLLHRKYDFWTSLAFSTLIQLLYNPYSIFDLGLILSYGGVIGLVVLNNFFKEKLKFNLISETISANIFIAPILAYNFNTLSLTFLISNLFAVILIEPITIIGIISIIFRFKFLFVILNFLLYVFRKIVEICAQIPFSKIYIITPSIISIVGYYVLWVIILKKKKINKANKKIVILIIIIILSNLNFEVIDSYLNKKLLINFVDVGQGDCMLIRTGTKVILIDGGGSSDNNYDIGKSIDIPYLLDRKIKTLDYIMISHFDTDHVRTDCLLL